MSYNPDTFFDVRRFGAKGDGATDDTAALNLACEAAGPLAGTVYVPPTASGYVIRRQAHNIAEPGDTFGQWGGIRLHWSNVTLLGSGTKLILTDNCCFIGINSAMNFTNGANGLPYMVVTADVVAGDSRFVVDDLGQVAVGDRVLFEFIQNTNDAGEPDYWSFASVVDKQTSSGAGWVQLDQTTTFPMTVAGITNTVHKSIRKVVRLTENVTVRGFNMVSDLYAGVPSSGVTAVNCRNIRVEDCYGWNTGSGIVAAQFVDVLRATNLISHATWTFGAGGARDCLALAEVRNAVFESCTFENFESHVLSVEAGCQNVVLRDCVINNNFYQPPFPITTPATGQPVYVYSGAVPSYLQQGSMIRLSGGANPVEDIYIATVNPSRTTVTLVSNILNAGHTTAQVIRGTLIGLVNTNDDHNDVLLDNLTIVGNPTGVYTGYGGFNSPVRFNDLVLEMQGNLADGRLYGQLPLYACTGKLTVNRHNYITRRTHQMMIYLAPNTADQEVHFPLGRIARLRVYTPSTTGITHATALTFDEDFSGWAWSGASLQSSFVAGQWVDLSTNLCLLQDALIHNGFNHNDQNGIEFDTDATWPGGVVAVEIDVFEEQPGDWTGRLTDTAFGAGLSFDISTALPIGSGGLSLGTGYINSDLRVQVNDFSSFSVGQDGSAAHDTLNISNSNHLVQFPNGTSLRFYSGNYTGQTIRIDAATGHMTYAGTITTAAAGANAGTTPPSPLVATGSTDTRGSLTFGTGTTPAAGAQAVVSFANAYVAAPFVMLTPLNAATAALQPYVTSVGTGGFTIAFGVAPAASQANTVYAVGYRVTG